MQSRLTDTAVKQAKPGPKPYKMADGAGMYLLVSNQGGACRRWWRLDYRLDGKRYTISLGVYPDVKLKTARVRCSAARELVAAGVNPSAVRKEAKAARRNARTFKDVAEEWLAKHRPTWAPTHTEKVEGRLRGYVYPWLGSARIDAITAAELLRVLRRIESQGHTRNRAPRPPALRTSLQVCHRHRSCRYRHHARPARGLGPGPGEAPRQHHRAQGHR